MFQLFALCFRNGMCVLFLSSLLCLSLLVVPVSSAPSNLREYEIKAVYLFRFGRFVTFPDQDKKANLPFNICLTGNQRLGKALEQATRSEQIDERDIQVVYLQTIQHIQGCEILYISSAEQQQLPDIMQALKNYPVLTVSDIRNFIEYGGMVEFFNRRNRVHFMISQKVVAQSGLRLSARLLQVAKLVE